MAVSVFSFRTRKRAFKASDIALEDFIVSSDRAPGRGLFFVFRKVISEHRKSMIESSESDPETISGLYYPLCGDGITSASIAKVTTFRFFGEIPNPDEIPL